MHIATVGDVALDVIVDVPGGLSPDDDAEATITLSGGGQAANVAAWVTALGHAATLIGPRGDSAAAGLVVERLRVLGVAFAGVAAEGGGTVVSLVASGTRTMASDAGDQSWLTRVSPSDLPDDADWLHVSAYPLLRAADATSVLDLCFEARTQGTRVSVDLASARLIAGYGVEAFAGLVDDPRPDVVFANLLEWQTVGHLVAVPQAEIVVKHGREGATVGRGDAEARFAAPVVDVVDATGAGDAFAAGYLVGGIELALQAAAQCLGIRGAQPPAEIRPRPPGSAPK